MKSYGCTCGSERVTRGSMASGLNGGRATSSNDDPIQVNHSALCRNKWRSKTLIER